MVSFTPRFRIITLLVWALALAAFVVWSHSISHQPGWDLRVYEHAMDSLRLGHDPYADGIAVQRDFHAHLAEHPDAPPPFTYVYSPLTLLPLRLLAHIPQSVFHSLYWFAYAIAALVPVWFAFTLAQPHERRAIALLAPLTFFLTGLLWMDVIFSGNVAYILYAFLLAAAVVGWRRNQWSWFYATVLVASCIKAPLLVLIAIPVFSARRQWIPAGLTGLAGVGLFAMQPLLWPTLFHNYLTAVELQFSFNHDFSASPAGLLADALYDKIPYTLTSAACYLVYASAIVALLFFLSRRFLRGEFSLESWAPVLLLGVTLLNPRVMEYDVAPITIPMALVAWRFLAREQTPLRAAVPALLLLGAWNIASLGAWRVADCILLVVLLPLGIWNLWPLPVTAPQYRLAKQRYADSRSYV